MLSYFKNIPAKLFLVGVRKNICTASISRRPKIAFSKHFESKCLSISVYLCKKSFIPES